MLLGKEKVPFLHLPTPLEYLPGVSQDLGVEFYIKRDDLTNLGVGGNKLRKLEYLLKDAQDQGATVLLTLGGAQTNHGRLTAAVAAKYGMKCAIVCVDDYPGELSANLLLDRLMGAEVILKHDDGRLRRRAEAGYLRRHGENGRCLPGNGEGPWRENDQAGLLLERMAGGRERQHRAAGVCQNDRGDQNGL